MSSPLAPAALLSQLVAIPSVSHLSNAPVIDWLQQFFLPLNWQQRIFCYRDASGTEKQNLVVSPQLPAEGPIEAELAIVCHTDTVPYSAAWTDAITLREQDGILHGCGACDVKGFLACMLAAASALDITGLHRCLCFVFTADEEIGCRGARFLFESGSLHAQYAIVGEPTSLLPARAGKGYCLASVKVSGKAAHSAFPAAGASAILAAARLLGAIEAFAQELQDDRDDAFTPPFTTINVGEIHGGTAKNVVPAECSFLLEWRPIPSQPPELVAERVRELIHQLQHSLGPEVRIEIEVLRLDAGFATPVDSPVVRAVQTHPATAAQSIAFGTEAPWLARMGAEAVVIGPGSMLTAHSPRECVPIAELNACTALLRSAIEQLCG